VGLVVLVWENGSWMVKTEIVEKLARILVRVMVVE
jgi:hypothetical protein